MLQSDVPRRVQLQDNTFPDRVGWKAIVSAPGSGTAVRTATPSGDPTGGLRRYPRDLLASPADRRSASFSVRPGDGSLTAPGATRGGSAESRAEDGFAGLFADAASGQGVLLVLLAAAFGWGALHALSPGHGKAMVAAYLIGTRGTRRDAVLLGATVTVTHTIGVFALGLVTLGLSQYVLPEDLYPWLTLVSGLMVVIVGASVLRSRLRPTREHSHEHGAHPRPRPPPRPHSPRRPLHGRRRRADPLPLGAGGPARCDRPARGGARDAADRRLQPRPGRHADPARPRRGSREAVRAAADCRESAGKPHARGVRAVGHGRRIRPGRARPFPVSSDKRRTRNELRHSVSTGRGAGRPASGPVRRRDPAGGTACRVSARPSSRIRPGSPGGRDFARRSGGRRHAQGGEPRGVVGSRARHLPARARRSPDRVQGTASGLARDECGKGHRCGDPRPCGARDLQMGARRLPRRRARARERPLASPPPAPRPESIAT